MSVLYACDVGVLWPNGWMDQNATWYGDRRQAYCGQMVGLIWMPLGMEVGLGPDRIVLDGDPALPTERDTAALTLRPTLLGHSATAEC